jgi:predicted transposase YdaD
MARILIPIMVKLHIEQREKPAQDRDPLDHEFLMETQDLYEAWHQRVRAEALNEGRDAGRIEGRNAGRIEGRDEGRKEGCANGVANALLRVLATRGLTVSREQEAQVRSCRDVPQLERWLDRALTATTVDEVLR